jgi:uncharacterized RDD family membrane protein YckC
MGWRMSENEEKHVPPPPSLTPPAPPPPEPEVSRERGTSAPVDLKTRLDQPESEDSLEAGSLAPLNSRLLGGLIDGMVGAGISFTVAWFMPTFLERFAWLLAAAYWVTRDSLPFLKGQSIGKMAMKIRVVKQDGGDMIGDWQTAIVRNAALLVPFFGALVEAIVLISRDSRPDRGSRLGDDWAKTKVVNAPNPTEGHD